MTGRGDRVLLDACRIAERELRSCYSEHGILAGLNQFSDYWARDGLFASLGALAIGDHMIVRNNLDFFARHQNKEGQIPIRIGNYFIGLKAIGFRGVKELRPRYSQDKYFSNPTDQNSLFVIVFHEYVTKTGDYGFLADNVGCLLRAIKWNIMQDRDRDLLIEEGCYATWADSIKKRGRVLYTNVLHCEALRRVSELCRELKKKDEARYYSVLHHKVKEKINELFWNGRFYIDWIDKRREEFFSTDGNVLAVLFGIADKGQAGLIEGFIDESGINKPVPSKTNYPSYPADKVSFWEHAALIGDYHNGMGWLWLGCIDILSRNKAGMKKEAEEVMLRIAKTIAAHKGVYEVYGRDAKPVKRLIYRSEQPFAWSAGLFLYAVNQMMPRIVRRALS